MFKVGDTIKVRLDVASDQYSWCQNTTVYNKMMELAKTKRFKIVGDNGSNYEVQTVGENVQVSHPRDEIHEMFELATD